MRFFLKYSYKIVAYEKIVQLFKNINSDKQTYKKLIKLGDLTGLVYLESLKESLPEWAYSGYTIKDELVDGDVDKRFKNKLEKIRAKNSTP